MSLLKQNIACDNITTEQASPFVFQHSVASTKAKATLVFHHCSAGRRLLTAPAFKVHPQRSWL